MLFQCLRGFFGNSDEREVANLTHDPENGPHIPTDHFSCMLSFLDAIESEKVERAGIVRYPTFDIAPDPRPNGSEDAKIAIQLLGAVLYALFSGKTVLSSPDKMTKIKSSVWPIVKEMANGRATTDVVRLRTAVREAQRRADQRAKRANAVKQTIADGWLGILMSIKNVLREIFSCAENLFHRFFDILPFYFAAGIIVIPIIFDIMNGPLHGGSLGFIGGAWGSLVVILIIIVFSFVETNWKSASTLLVNIVCFVVFSTNTLMWYRAAGILYDNSRTMFVVDRTTGTYIGHGEKVGEKVLVTNLKTDQIDIWRYTTINGFLLQSEFVISDDDVLKLRVAYSIDEALLLKHKDSISTLLRPALPWRIVEAVETPLKSYLRHYREVAKNHTYNFSYKINGEEILFPDSQKQYVGKKDAISKEAALLIERATLIEGANRTLRTVKLPGDGAITVKIAGLQE